MKIYDKDAPAGKKNRWVDVCLSNPACAKEASQGTWKPITSKRPKIVSRKNDQTLNIEGYKPRTSGDSLAQIAANIGETIKKRKEEIE